MKHKFKYKFRIVAPTGTEYSIEADRATYNNQGVAFYKDLPDGDREFILRTPKEYFVYPVGAPGDTVKRVRG